MLKGKDALTQTEAINSASTFNYYFVFGKVSKYHSAKIRTSVGVFSGEETVRITSNRQDMFQYYRPRDAEMCIKIYIKDPAQLQGIFRRRIEVLNLLPPHS